MAHLVRIGDDCLTRAGIACMSCRDMCPEAAIRMQPRIGAPFHPVLDAALCTGCGACIAPCPADAIVPIRKEPADA
jgi:ferredoxin-type protein NapF